MSIYLGNQLVAGNSDNGVPTGTILPYGGSTAPNGFLLCDGSAVSRTTYAALYAVIGDAYGAGDGNSTFNLPNSRDRVLQGVGTRGTVGTALNESLPNITGKIYARGIGGTADVLGWESGCFIRNIADKRQEQRVTSDGIFDNTYAYNIDASRSSSVYQDRAHVQPDALCINYIIKY